MLYRHIAMDHASARIGIVTKALTDVRFRDGPSSTDAGVNRPKCTSDRKHRGR
jgi:hypothetical protein